MEFNNIKNLMKWYYEKKLRFWHNIEDNSNEMLFSVMVLVWFMGSIFFLFIFPIFFLILSTSANLIFIIGLILSSIFITIKKYIIFKIKKLKNEYLKIMRELYKAYI